LRTELGIEITFDIKEDQSKNYWKDRGRENGRKTKEKN
jgi:hypothetical protein